MNKYSDDVRKHLDYIEATISRMANDSFLTRGWGITVITAIAISFSKSLDLLTSIIGLLITLIFWILDSYYLALEREYRKLYGKVISYPNETDYNMKVSLTIKTQLSAMFSYIFWVSYMLLSIVWICLIIWIK